MHHGRIDLASRERHLLGLRVQRWLHGPQRRDVHGVRGWHVQGGVGSRIVQQLPLGYRPEPHASKMDWADVGSCLALVRRLPEKLQMLEIGSNWRGGKSWSVDGTFQVIRFIKGVRE